MLNVSHNLAKYPRDCNNLPIKQAKCTSQLMKRVICFQVLHSLSKDWFPFSLENCPKGQGPLWVHKVNPCWEKAWARSCSQVTTRMLFSSHATHDPDSSLRGTAGTRGGVALPCSYTPWLCAQQALGLGHFYLPCWNIFVPVLEKNI